jgi:hypothetical protein
LYSNVTAYVQNDYVTDNLDGNAYACHTATTGNGEPSTDPAHWTLIALAGATGPQGVQGLQGIQGVAGPAGADGADGQGGFAYDFDDSVAVGDPGAGNFRFNNATFTSATKFLVSTTDADANLLDLAVYVGNGPVMANFLLRSSANPNQIVSGSITGTTLQAGWVEFDVTVASSTLTILDGEGVSLALTRAGDVGDPGPQGDPGNDGADGADGADALSAVRSVTTTDTATAADGVLLCNATLGAFTQNLPDPIANEGKVLAIVKVDASANAVTVEDVNGETGLNAYKLRKQYDAIMVVADGAGEWVNVADRKAPRDTLVPVTGGHGPVAYDSQIAVLYVVEQELSLLASADARFVSQNQAQFGTTGACLYSIRVNGVQVGTITFTAPGQFSGIVVISTQQDLSPGDILTVVGPATADATLAAYGITLTLLKVGVEG